VSGTNSRPGEPSRIPRGFQFRVPWRRQTDSNVRLELATESSKDYFLFGITARTVARRQV